MNKKMRIQLFTGPLNVDWLIAELYYDEELWGELTEWGETLIIYPRQDGKPWHFSSKDALETINIAKEKVGRVSND